MSGTTQAAQCRNTYSVIQSAKDPQRNVRDGGHIWQHIYGITKPTGASSLDTQLHKTLFYDLREYDDAWYYFRGLPGTFKNCPSTGGSNRADIVDSRSIGITDARYCNAVDSYKMCTSAPWYTMGSRKVVFCYKYISSTKNWILRTAYPKRYLRNRFNDIDKFADEYCDDARFENEMEYETIQNYYNN